MELPLTATMFDRDKADEFGFKRVCKQCRSEKRQKLQDQKLDERLQKFDKQSIELLDRMLAEGSDVPHHAEIFQEIVRLMGGVGGFAGHFVAQFLATPIGKKERSEMLRLLIKMSEAVTKTGVATVPMEMLTDEDLDRMHRDQLAVLLKQTKNIEQADKILAAKEYVSKLEEQDRLRESDALEMKYSELEQELE